MLQCTLKTPGEMVCIAQYMNIDKGPWINVYNAFGVAKNAQPNRVAQYVGYNATPALSRVSSDERHFNVYKTVPTNHNPFEENEEPKQNRAQALLLEYQSNAFPLGQTRSMCICTMLSTLQKTSSKTIYCIICTMLSMWPGSGVTRGQFSLRSSRVLHSFSVSVLQHLHHSFKSCAMSYRFSVKVSESSNKGVN